MVPRCSATWRAEYKRVMPSNRGLASHVAVSPISDSNEFMAGFPATSESNVLMTGSCRSLHRGTSRDLDTQICVTQVPSRPDARMYSPARCLTRAVFAVEVDVGQVVCTTVLERSG